MATERETGRIRISDKEWEQYLGGYRDSGMVRRDLERKGLSLEELKDRRQILALPAVESDQTFFPEFQFNLEGIPYSIIEDVIKGLEPVTATPYSIAIWINSRQGFLNNSRPAELLKQGVDTYPDILDAVRYTVLNVTDGQQPINTTS